MFPCVSCKQITSLCSHRRCRYLGDTEKGEVKPKGGREKEVRHLWALSCCPSSTPPSTRHFTGNPPLLQHRHPIEQFAFHWKPLFFFLGHGLIQLASRFRWWVWRRGCDVAWRSAIEVHVNTALGGGALGCVECGNRGRETVLGWRRRSCEVTWWCAPEIYPLGFCLSSSGAPNIGVFFLSLETCEEAVEPSNVRNVHYFIFFFYGFKCRRRGSVSTT